MVEVSEKALNEFKKVLEAEGNKGLGIKIKAYVSQSSCCSCGPNQHYEMGLVEGGDEGDSMAEKGGVRFYMDEASAELMKGYEVDFMEEMGFVIKDGSAPSCGCGDHDPHGGSCCG